MCGIVGILNLSNKKVYPKEIKEMTDAISHRGPDAEGQWLNNSIGLGHRRLSIIDLTTFANQPMISNDKRFVLTFNGEIYNYLEIKKSLEKLGYQFKSKSDSEVVLYSLIEWGSKALVKFNGMFAFAFWDNRDKQLLLARDRYGIKPIYIALQKKRIFFASEQKAILSQLNFCRTLNKSALVEYFTFQNIFTDKTLLNDIYLLPAGHFINIDSKKQYSHLEWQQYWDFHFQEPDRNKNNFEYYEELDRLFNQAVKRQLVSDVEIGSYLSGGIDSGAITAIASQNLDNLKTFTCGFDLNSASGLELSYDERAKAEFMSAEFKTEHYEIVLKSGDMENSLYDLTWHLEEPRVGQSYPNFYAAKLASNFVKVVLSGSGGDEIFGGYPWRYLRLSSSHNFDNFIDEYYLYWQRLINNKMIKKVFSPIFPEIKDIWTRDIFSNVFKTHKNNLKTPHDYINHCLYFEAKTFLHGLLVVEDKLSMAHGLENRVPFLDNDLVEFAMNCPISLKFKHFSKTPRLDENTIGSKTENYYQRTNDGKNILRKVMSKYIPKKIISAPKQGFSAPDGSWFKGESVEFVKKIINDKNSSIYQFFDQKTVKSLVNEHLTGKRNRRLLIWSLLNFNEWINQNL